MMEANRANQHVHWRARDAGLATFITGARGFFVIFDGQHSIREVSQVIAQAAELSGLTQTGEQFLADRTEKLSSTIVNNLI